MGKRVVLCLLAGAVASGEVEEKSRREERYTLPSGPRKVIVDGVSGSITARGRSANDVRLVVDERWRAENPGAMAEARRDVVLRITQEGNVLRVYVDGPFRCRQGCGDRDNRDYNVNFDFDLDLPRDAAIEFKTVNGGSVKAADIDGDFVVRNVNGGIELSEMGGSGSAHTVNGELRAEFPASLSADIAAKNLNGSIFTDFEATALAARVEDRRERQGTRYVYRSKGGARVRIAQGGPEHKFETLNGDIEIAKRVSK